MSESISAEDGRRAPRVKLAGVVLALIQLENGRQIRSRLHQLSITGGLLYLDDPLDEGIKVEVMFFFFQAEDGIRDAVARAARGARPRGEGHGGADRRGRRS